MATCEACAANIGDLPNPSGVRGDGIGTCKNCHSIACGHHGQREPNVPEFICVECNPSLLIASAAMLEQEEDRALSEDLEAAARTYHRFPDPGPWVIRSPEDWAERNVGFGHAHAQAFIVRGDVADVADIASGSTG